MAQLSVRQAALHVGISRQTMFKKVRSGTVSATTDKNGAMQIDTAELLRVFGELQSPGSSQRSSAAVKRQMEKVASDSTGLQLEVTQLKAQLEIKAYALATAEERLDELKRRAEKMESERDRLLSLVEKQSAHLLELKQSSSVIVPPAPSPEPMAKDEPEPTKKQSKKDKKQEKTFADLVRGIEQRKAKRKAKNKG